MADVHEENEERPVPLSGTRAQAIQRLQVGLFGLAAMILLVALASVIMTRAKQNEASVVPEAAHVSREGRGARPASNPLAEAGVVPDLPDERERPLVAPESAEPTDVPPVDP